MTANNIDDATGSLDGYVAVVYEGLEEVPADTSSERETNQHADETSKKLNEQTQTSHDENSDEITASEILSENQEHTQVPTVEAVRALYLDKNASSFVVDVAHPQRFDERTVIRAGSYTFGILYYDSNHAKSDKDLRKKDLSQQTDISSLFSPQQSSLTNNTEAHSDSANTESHTDSASDITADQQENPVTYLERRVQEYRDENIDFVIAVVSDLSLVSAEDGIDIVISTQEEGLITTGASVDGVFYVDAAHQSEVGTVLISPSRTITAKDITSL